MENTYKVWCPDLLIEECEAAEVKDICPARAAAASVKKWNQESDTGEFEVFVDGELYNVAVEKTLSYHGYKPARRPQGDGDE